MSGEIGAAIQGMKVIYEIAKANKGLLNYNELVSAVAEVNGKLVEANAVALASQKEQMALSNQVSELEKIIMEMENWKSEAERYQLAELSPDVFVFTLKPGMENGEPPHNLCTACMSKRQKGYLNKTNKNVAGTFYTCSLCNKEIVDRLHKSTPSKDPYRGPMCG